LLAPVVWAATVGTHNVSGQTNVDITFFVGSDLHYGYVEGTNYSADVCRATLDCMNALPGQSYPAGAGGGTIAPPRGVLLIGDLTETGAAANWGAFTNDWGLNGERRLAFPVYEAYGNHDCRTPTVPEGIRARNPLRTGVSNLSTNGYHYSWDWDSLHLVCLNLFPGQTRDAYGSSDSRGSLSFLVDDLARNVGNSGRAVVIYHHYGFDSFGLDYWTNQQRSAYLQAIKNYNVIAIFAGHNHLVDYIPWQGLNTFNDGTVGKTLAGSGYVISFLVAHVTGNHLTVAERRLDGTWGNVFNANITTSLDPWIINNPVSTTAPVGSATTMVVEASGPNLNYQWFFNRTNAIDGATNSTLYLTNLGLSQSGDYFVLVTNSAASITSAVAVLTVFPPPVITASSQTRTNLAGTVATFSATASGFGPLSYEWLRNGVSLHDDGNIRGATAATLQIANVQPADAGNFVLTVSNPAGAAAATVATLVVEVPPPCAPVPPGLVGWWAGEGNANDLAGTNHGALLGDASASAAGKVGQAFSFDGTNGFVQIPDSPQLKPANLTIDAWVLFSALDSAGAGGSLPGQQYIVFKQNSGSTIFEGYHLGKTRTADGDVFSFIVSSASGQALTLQSATLVTTGVWYHVAAVRGSNFTQLYVNGQLEGQTNVSFPQDYGTNALFFGCSGQPYWDHKFAGMLDKVSLYSRALASDEIATIHTAGAAGKCQQAIITAQPESQTALVGSNVSFTVTALGPALSYQWFLRTAGLTVGAAASLLVRAHAATGTIQDVQHVVILMQENRSFDHYFGTLKGVRGFNDPNALVLPNRNTDFYQPINSSYVLPFHITAQCLNDVFHSEPSDYAAWHSGKWDQWIPAKGPATMAYYTRDDLPFYYALAEAYTICDEYHCSVLGPTYPNRLYLMTGTIDPNGVAGGPVTDNNLSQPYRWTTYPERLQAAGVAWKVYQQASDYYNLNALRWFTQYANAAPGSPLRVRGLTLVNNLLATFKSDVTNGTLPQVSWIIPPWSLAEHPPFPPASGEILTKQLLDILASNPSVYSSTVFILTYDEDGGFFDHVPSPVPPPGTTNEFVGGLPTGLGIRVPTILVSPWTRGGYVCSQIFDHTSIIRFLEQWTGVQEPNISAWRRQVCGDLTSAFDFTLADTNYPFLPPAPTVTCTTNITPTPPMPQIVPTQEAGTNLSRPRPYRINAFSFADCATLRLEITMTNAGTASAHFSIYANAYRIDGPWQYDVPAGSSVTDYFSASANGGRYDLTCYGPHRFHQRFAGNISTNCNLLNVEASLDPGTDSVTLAVQNATTTAVTFTIANDAQPGGPSTYLVLPGYAVTNTFPGALNADGTYHLTAAASGDPTFLREFAGDSDDTALGFSINAPPVVTNAPPVVSIPSISLSGANLILTYPLWASGYTLESATNFVSGSWTAVNAVPVTNGDNSVVTLPISDDAMYFRLRP
jgi:phospholipase C